MPYSKLQVYRLHGPDSHSSFLALRSTPPKRPRRRIAVKVTLSTPLCRCRNRQQATTWERKQELQTPGRTRTGRYKQTGQRRRSPRKWRFRSCRGRSGRRGTPKRTEDYGSQREHTLSLQSSSVEPSPTLVIQFRREEPQEQPYIYLAASSSSSSSAPPPPSLQSDFKPAVKVLSRKPAPQVVTRRDPVTGQLSQLTLDDKGPGADEVEAAKSAPSPEEIRARQLRELEEKQRKYREARAKIFGETPTSGSSSGGSGGAVGGSAAGSGASTPRNSTPPLPSLAGQQTAQGGGTTATNVAMAPGEGGFSGGRGGRGRGRGGFGGGRGGGSSLRGRGGGSSEQSDGLRQGGQPTRELYDPNAPPRQPSLLRKGAATSEGGSGASSPRGPHEEQAIRAPRGPDGSGRGGFGFARRVGRGEGGEGGAPLQ